MSYYIFDSQIEAAAALAAAEAEMRAIAAERGFTVLPNGAVVGKNAATGADVPEALTLGWAEVTATQDGRWCFPSCRSVFSTTHPRIEQAAQLPAPQPAVLASPPIQPD